MHYRKSIPTALVVLGLTLGAHPAAAAGPSRVAASDAEITAALQRDLGLTADQARTQRALQAKAITLDSDLRASLGAAFAGSVYDAKTGKLVVSVSDSRRVDDVRAAGATARLVKHSEAQLAATKAQLDGAGAQAKGTGSQGRPSRSSRMTRSSRIPGPRWPAPDGATSRSRFPTCRPRSRPCSAEAAVGSARSSRPGRRMAAR